MNAAAQTRPLTTPRSASGLAVWLRVHRKGKTQPGKWLKDHFRNEETMRARIKDFQEFDTRVERVEVSYTRPEEA